MIRPQTPRDLNSDGWIDLTDAVLGLEVVTGLQTSEAVYSQSDVNADGQIGMVEVIFILQKVAGVNDQKILCLIVMRSFFAIIADTMCICL